MFHIRIYTSLFTLLLGFFADAQIHNILMPESKSDRLTEYQLAEYHLHGPVKSCEYHYFEAEYTEGHFIKIREAENPDVHFKNQITFTPTGFVHTMKAFRDLQGTINFLDTLSFNDDGLPVEMRRHFRDGTIKFSENFVYESGNMIRWMYNRNERVQSTQVCDYSNDGKILKITEINHYHPEPFDTWQRVGDTSDVVEYVKNFHYNEDKVISIVTEYPGRYEKLVQNFEYDTNGLISGKIFKNEIDGYYKRDWIEDSEIVSVYSEQSTASKNITSYTPWGDPLILESYENGSLKLRQIYEYVFDSHGNWISRCYRTEGTNYPQYWCDERIIEYFE